MSELTADRKRTWLAIRALFDLAWKGHGYDSDRINALERLGLSGHANDAILVAAEMMVRECQFPPTPADWFNRLDGKKVRVPVQKRDLWGRTMLKPDGSPVIVGWGTENEASPVYVELAKRKGLLPDPGARDLGVRKLPDLDRAENDGEPHPLLPRELIDRAGGGR